MPEGEGLVFIDLDDLVRCEAVHSYTLFILKDKREMMVTKPLNDFELLFVEHNILRVHRSHLVNTDYIKKYNKGDIAYLVLQDDTQIPVSRSGKLILNDKFLKN